MAAIMDEPTIFEVPDCENLMYTGQTHSLPLTMQSNTMTITVDFKEKYVWVNVELKQKSSDYLTVTVKVELLSHRSSRNNPAETFTFAVSNQQYDARKLIPHADLDKEDNGYLVNKKGHITDRLRFRVSVQEQN